VCVPGSGWGLRIRRQKERKKRSDLTFRSLDGCGQFLSLIWRQFPHYKGTQKCGRTDKPDIWLPNGLLVQTDPGPHPRAAPGPTPSLWVSPFVTDGLPAVVPGPAGRGTAASNAASACRGRPGSAARPLPRGPAFGPASLGAAPARPGPSNRSAAQPPPKPGEPESGRRRSLRGTLRADWACSVAGAVLLSSRKLVRGTRS
jgi:hypothetical protein